jgi:hypothetical protein
MPQNPDEEKFSDPIDQIALVLGAIKDPQERAHLLFDPHRYAAKNRIRLDPGFTEALRGEVARLNQTLMDTEDKFGISLPRIDDPRTESLPSFTIRPGEVATLPIAAICTIAEIIAACVQILAEMYATTKFRSELTSGR